MPIRIVQSKQNTRLKELRRALANPGRNESGLAGVEGPNLVEEALRAGVRIATVFGGQGSEKLIERLKLPPEIEVLMLPRELLDSALATETPQAIAALVEPPDWTWAHLLGADKSAAPLIVVLAGLQDPVRMEAGEAGRVPLEGMVATAIRPLVPIYGIAGREIPLAHGGHRLLVRFHANDLGKAVFDKEPLAIEDGSLLMRRFDAVIRFRPAGK